GASGTWGRTVSDMPMKAVRAENSAPTRKNTLRPQRTPSPLAGSTSSTKKIRTTKMPSVLNWRFRTLGIFVVLIFFVLLVLPASRRSEEHTSALQSPPNLPFLLLL